MVQDVVSPLTAEPELRPYATGDREALLAFLAETLTELGFEFEPDGKDSDVANVPAAYLNRRGSFFVLEHEGRIAGSVAIRPLTADTGELKRLYLDRRLRGRGLGRALCRAAIDSGRALGYARLRLDTTARSPAAISLFEKLGFLRIPAYIEDPYAEIFMELEIST